MEDERLHLLQPHGPPSASSLPHPSFIGGAPQRMTSQTLEWRAAQPGGEGPRLCLQSQVQTQALPPAPCRASGNPFALCQIPMLPL